jgi:hypothetical protein
MKNIVNIAGIIGIILLSPQQAVAQMYVNTEKTCIQLRIQKDHQKKPELSACGFKFEQQSRIVFYIDPKCDLYGRLRVGDKFLTLNGMDAVWATKHRYNFGNDQTPVDCVFETQYGLVHMTCTRHPISWFSPCWFRADYSY